MGIAYTLMGYMGRGFFGVVLAMSLGLLGVIAGWGLFVMSGSASWHVWFWSGTGGAGVGAAVGASLAWLTGEAPRPLGASALLFAAIAAAGIAGAYGGYHWGQVQEVPCCASPDSSSTTYTVSGAMAATLGAATMLGIFSQRMWRLPRPPFALRLSARGARRSPWISRL